jgi:hypothetical protein
MNYTFTKKPVVIEAFQMTKERGSDSSDWPGWLREAWKVPVDEIGSLQTSCVSLDGSYSPFLFEIVTLEGVMLVSWGDWIIRGVKGEIYPCKPDIFEMTYEPYVDFTEEVDSMSRE